MHGQSIPLECAVIEVTTIREGHDFEDLDYPDKEEGIVKLKDAIRIWIFIYFKKPITCGIILCCFNNNSRVYNL
jgi:hypothetical protein